jgi:hypothetical protein
LATPVAAPANDTERHLAEILERLLGLTGVGRDDDFFALGGDSLVGTQFIAGINRRFGSRLTLLELFEGATVAALAARLDVSAAVKTGRIQPAPRQADYPLTHAQERLWILAHNPQASVAYNMSYNLRLGGAVNVEALRAAFNLLVERHEALHTAFVGVAGEPRQQVRPIETFDLPVRDLSGELEPAASARRLVHAESMEPFDLGRPPLLRARLLRIAGDEHVLLVSLQHIVADGLSLNVLIRELHAAYAAFCTGRTPELPPLPLQFKDFAVWERQQLDGPAMQEHRAYWLEKLGGELPVLALPTDRPHSQAQGFSGGNVVLRLPSAARDQLHACCREQGVSLFMLLTAALKVLLHHATGQDDILIGSPVAGREQAELGGVIGYFLNTVVLRDTIQRSEPFTALLRRVRTTVTEALTHQSYPFDRLIEELAVVPPPGHAPLFDVQLNLMPGEALSLRLGDLTVEEFVHDEATTMFDLNFMFSEGPRGLALEIAYSTALFESTTVERMGERLLHLLTVISEQPDITVRSLCDLFEKPMAALEKAEFLAAALNLDDEF